MERLADIVYLCAFCGYQYPRDYPQKWGVDGRGQGLGPKPVCEQLVETASGSGAVCGGDLVAISVEHASPDPGA